MTKKEVQQRVLIDGKPLDLDKFEWDEKTNTFSSGEDRLVLDFEGVNGCTFKTGWGCTFDTGWDCTFDTGERCVAVRRDIYEVIELEADKPIKLHEYMVKGFEHLEKSPTILEKDGKRYEVEIIRELLEE